jgi:hypothetical protein
LVGALLVRPFFTLSNRLGTVLFCFVLLVLRAAIDVRAGIALSSARAFAAVNLSEEPASLRGVWLLAQSFRSEAQTSSDDDH